MVAVPLWTAFHMAPEGKGFAGDRVMGGYGIMLEAALRPVLVIFGMLFAYTLMWGMMVLFHRTYAMTIGTINSEDIWDILFSITAQSVIYLMMTIFIIEKCCDVIDVLPATVMRWVNIHAAPGTSDLEHKVQGGIVAAKSDMRGGLAAAKAPGANDAKEAAEKATGGIKVNPTISKDGD